MLRDLRIKPIRRPLQRRIHAEPITAVALHEQRLLAAKAEQAALPHHGLDIRRRLRDPTFKEGNAGRQRLAGTQRCPHCRPRTIGTDHDVGLGLHTIGEAQAVVACLCKHQLGQAMAPLHRVGRQRIQQQLAQVAAVDLRLVHASLRPESTGGNRSSPRVAQPRFLSLVARHRPERLQQTGALQRHLTGILVQIQRAALGALLPRRLALVHAHAVAAAMQDECGGQAGGASADDGDTWRVRHEEACIVVYVSTVERSG
ncbi:hypothetical protein D3C81_611370 [compost metagenome]